MQKIILGAIIAVVTLFIIKYCNDKNKEKIILKNHTTLIQKQIKNVGGYFGSICASNYGMIVPVIMV